MRQVRVLVFGRGDVFHACLPCHGKVPRTRHRLIQQALFAPSLMKSSRLCHATHWRQDHAHVGAIGQNREWRSLPAAACDLAQRLPDRGAGFSAWRARRPSRFRVAGFKLSVRSGSTPSASDPLVKARKHGGFIESRCHSAAGTCERACARKNSLFP